MGAVLAASLGLAACATTAADRPLTVALGLDRAATAAALRAHAYCHTDQGRRRDERFPRCKRPGIELNTSWVDVEYDSAGASAQARRVQRWERYADDAHASQRWNALVEARAQVAPPSAEVRRAVLASEELPVGTHAWAAFRIDAATVVGVYLLDRGSPVGPAVLEQILALPE